MLKLLLLIVASFIISCIATDFCAHDCSKATIQRICNLTDEMVNTTGYYVDCDYMSAGSSGTPRVILACNCGANSNFQFYSMYFPAIRYDNAACSTSSVTCSQGSSSSPSSNASSLSTITFMQLIAFVIWLVI